MKGAKSMKVNRTEHYILTLAITEVFDGISIYEMNGFVRNEPRKYGVNFSAQGTQEPKKALEYAAKIAKAARLADRLNSWEIVIDYKADGDITREELENTLKQVKFLINFEQWNQLNRYLEAVE